MKNIKLNPSKSNNTNFQLEFIEVPINQRSRKLTCDLIFYLRTYARISIISIDKASFQNNSNLHVGIYFSNKKRG